MLCRWLSRKSSKRRNFTAHRDLQSRQYTPISSSRDYRGQRSCEGQKKNKHTEISCPFTPHNGPYIGIRKSMVGNFFERSFLWLPLLLLFYCEILLQILKYCYCGKISCWNNFLPHTSCAHLEVRKQNFVAKIIKTSKTDTAKCITIHHTNVKHSLWGKNCFSNLEIMK